MGVADALRMMNAGLDYLNGPGAGELDAASCGLVLRSLGEIEAKFTAAHASVLARFDAADAHDSDGYGTSAAWLMAMTDMTRAGRQDQGAADAAAARPARHGRRPGGRGYLQVAGAGDRGMDQEAPGGAARGDDQRSWCRPPEAGASLDDLRMIAGVALERWRASRPDGDEDGFDDRYVQAATTFGGAGVIRGNLTPECAAAVQAVLEALGKKAGAEDTRTEGQRFHDALQAGCELLIGAKMVPDRAGADTHVAVHIPFPELRQRPGAPEAEEVWLRGAAGEPGYLTGKDAEAAACDAVAEPVVTGHADMRVVDKIIALALAAAGLTLDGAGPIRPATATMTTTRARTAPAARVTARGVSQAAGRGPRPGPGAGPASGSPPTRCRRCATPSPGSPSTSSPARPAWPAGCAPPCSPPRTTPRRCRWTSATPTPSRPASAAPSCSATAAAPGPRCGRPAAWCDVHHLQHKKDGGKTAVTDCVLLCQFHHDICIHRRGWRLVLHPDGTTTAYGPDGQVLHSHSPPTTRAG